MTERIWEWGELTPEVVRAWGYDDDLMLSEQDEDLLLYNVRFFLVLLELAGDDKCPKCEYAFCILCQFCREQVTRGDNRHAATLRAAWSSISKPASGRPLEWHEYVGRLLGYTQPPGAVKKDEARRMADDLLLGIAGRIGEISEDTPAQLGWWRFTLRTSLIEHVDVCEDTGAFSYTSYY